MKTLLGIVVVWCLFSFRPAIGAEATNGVVNEPTYRDKPLSYWLDGLGRWDNRATDAGQAVKSLGMPAVPFILRYTALRKDGTTNQSDTGRAVARACRALDEGRTNRQLEKSLRAGLKDTNAQVRINAIAGLPLSEKFIPELEKLGQDPELHVRQAATNSLGHLRRYNDWLKRKQTEEPKPPKSNRPRSSNLR
ncbi:MAG: HEAT repeat domain-containing protein [Verrucomicrobiota bacterium]